MRKYVAPIVILTLFYALSGCENNPATSEKKGDITKIVTNPFKKKKKPEIKDSVEAALPEGTIPVDTISAQVQKDSSDYEESAEDETDLVDSEAQVKLDSTDYFAVVDSTVVDSLDPSEDFPDQTDQDPYSEQGNYSDSGLRLEKEKLVKTDLIQVYRPDYKSQVDSALSLVEKRISLKPEEVSKVIVVERWISPVNYRGYKFNRKKLMLYGVDKEAPVRIYYYLNDYFLSLGKHIYYLEETVENTAFLAVQDSTLENYLIKYDPQL